MTNCSIHSPSARFCHTVWETLINICQPVIPSQNTPFTQINRLFWGYNGCLCLRKTHSVCGYMLFVWSINSYKTPYTCVRTAASPLGKQEIPWELSEVLQDLVLSSHQTCRDCQEGQPKGLRRWSSNQTNGAQYLSNSKSHAVK